MKILVTGSHGLVGQEVVHQLTAAGHFVVRLVRSNPDRDRGDAVWDPVSGNIERSALEGIEAVIHLAGESLMGIWTGGKKARIYNSRVVSTEYLCEALASLTPKPTTLICASAIGYYGSQRDVWLNESSPAGTGYLADLCGDWEEATRIASNAGIRVVNARIGIVLTPKGGALGGMLPAFKMGIGGPIGLGRGYMSWISIDDLVGGILHLLDNKSIEGPVNMTAPKPATNKEFTKALGSVLHRPTVLPVPSLLLKALPGRMAQETILSSIRAAPNKLVQSGYQFRHTDVEEALEELVGS